MFKNIKWLKNSIVVLAIILSGTTAVISQECTPDLDVKNRSKTELTEIIESCQQKLKTIKNQISTLSSQINFMNTQIYITKLKINQTQEDIQKTKEEINILETKIKDMDYNLTNLSKEFLLLTQEIYKIQSKPLFVKLTTADDFSDLLRQYKYLKTKIDQNHQLMINIQRTKLNYQDQVELREKKQEELNKLEQLLKQQETSLQDQQKSKQQLLEITKNDEKTYQTLLDKAKQELASFRSFIQSVGPSVIPADGLGKGELGWYYSQRDERWANYLISNSDMNIIEVGCLITDIAMIYKSEGYNITPLDIASESERFFSNTAYMLRPWKLPAGKIFNPISKTEIDQKLSEGKKVIVGVYAGKYGTHYVVLAKLDGNDYIMYDPYYGPDLKFSSKYSKASIFTAVAIE
ncbi:MAG: hypothetical protein KatS3mg090_0180 [Patescibacteria group bacterium]|nr:MAG: hypothetical protein KatS3mg090_0180 [Patescibacteria group bacterium]